MNSAAVLADTEDVQPTAGKYFVHVDRPPASAPRKRRRGRGAQSAQLSFFEEQSRPTRRRGVRKRGQHRFLIVVLAALAAAALWASQQPGGVSGTVNRSVQRVRNDLQDASGGAGLNHATTYFNDQYRATGVYPNPSADQLTAAGVDIDVDVLNCGGQAVVLHTVTVSRLLIAGTSRGDVAGSHGCPDDLANPSPWKSQ